MTYRVGFLFFIFSSLLLAQGAEIEFVDGNKQTLKSFSIHRLKLRSEPDDREWPIDKVIKINILSRIDSDATAFHEVKLWDGSVLKAKSLQFKMLEGRSQVDLELLENKNLTHSTEWQALKAESQWLSLPVSLIHYVYRNAHEISSYRNFLALLGQKSHFDRIVLGSSEEVNSLEGTVTKMDLATNSFDFLVSGNEKKTLRFNRIRGFIFSKAGMQSYEEKLAHITDIFGNKFFCKSLEIESNSLKVLPSSKYSLDKLDLSSVHSIDFSNAKAVFLSDLKPTLKSRESDEDISVASFALNSNLDHQLITLGIPKGRLVEPLRFQKGISLRTGVRVTFPLSEKFENFRAWVGVDERANLKNKGTLVLSSEDRILMSVPFETSKAATLIDFLAQKIDLKELKTISFEVNADPFEEDSQVSIANPVLTKE